MVWGLGIAPDVRIAASCDELLDNFLYITETQPVTEAFEYCEWAHLDSGSERLSRVDSGGAPVARE